MHGAYLRALQSTYMKLPKVGDLVWFQLPDEKVFCLCVCVCVCVCAT